MRSEDWISRNDRLPDQYTKCLLATRGAWFEGWLANGKFEDMTGRECDGVTHWMPVVMPKSEVNELVERWLHPNKKAACPPAPGSDATDAKGRFLSGDGYGGERM